MNIGNSSARALRLVCFAAFLGVLAPPARAAFDAPVTLSKAGQDARLAHVGVDADGDALIVWTRFTGANFKYVIQARSRTAAGALGPVQLVGAAGAGNESEAHVDVAANGDSLIVWTRYDGAFLRVQARFRSSAGALGPVQTLSPAGLDAHDPAVAMTPNGRAVIVWRLVDRVQARARSAAGVFSATQTLSATGSPVDSPVVGIADNGVAVFAWLRRNGTDYRVQARGRAAKGTLGPIQSVSLSAANVVAGSLDIAVDKTGDALMAWTNIGSGQTRVQARSRHAAGTLGPMKNLSAAGGQFADQPRIAIQDDGDAFVVWRANGVIQARTRSAAGALGAIQTISGGGGSTLPQVAFDENGVAVFVWEGPLSNIQARSRSAAGVFGPIEDVTPAGREAGLPHVAMDNGVATAVWHRDDSSGDARIQTAKGP